MSVGELVAFSGYLAMLAWPMIAFGWVTNLVQRGRASWGRMQEVLATVPAIDDRHVEFPEIGPEDVRGDVTFDNLSSATADAPVLAGVSLADSRRSDRRHRRADWIGQVHAAVAARAAARSATRHACSSMASTCARCRWRRARRDWASCRRSRSSSPTRSPGMSLRRPSAGRAKAWPHQRGAEQVAGPGFSPAEQPNRRGVAIAQLDKDVADFPQGYDTRIGERGITLSGGQKQRTAIARALYVDPRILILDDALSSVDTHTEDEILRGLRRYRTRPHDAHRRASHLDDSRRRPHRRARRRADRRAGDARGVGRRRTASTPSCIGSSCSSRSWRRRSAARDDRTRHARGTRDEAPHEERGTRNKERGAVQDEDVLGKAYDARLMRRLVQYLRPYWRASAVALVAILGYAGLQLVPP